MKPELTGKRLEFRYQQRSDHDLSITTQVHYTGTNPKEVCRAFFFDSFYLPDAPVLWAVTCTSE